eukprot:3896334-Rhodomonas_salina.1
MVPRSEESANSKGRKMFSNRLSEANNTGTRANSKTAPPSSQRHAHFSNPMAQMASMPVMGGYPSTGGYTGFPVAGNSGFPGYNAGVASMPAPTMPAYNPGSSMAFAPQFAMQPTMPMTYGAPMMAPAYGMQPNMMAPMYGVQPMQPAGQSSFPQNSSVPQTRSVQQAPQEMMSPSLPLPFA